MQTARFKIVFDKLSEASGSPDLADSSALEPMATGSEFDEIDELRRLSLELREPEPTSYTLT